MQESGFGGDARLYDMLEISLFIALDVDFGVLVASSCNQGGNLDDQGTQLSKGVLESGQEFL